MELGFGNCILLFAVLIEVLLAENPVEMVNDPRCTPRRYIIRFWEEREQTFLYAVLNPNPALLPDEEILEEPLTYDENLKKCISEVDNFCVSDKDCGTGAICNSTAISSTQFYCNPDNPRRLDPATNPMLGLCNCADGKVKDANNTGCLIMAKFGEYCDSVKKPCGPSVDCVNNKCVCAPRRAITRVDIRRNTTYYYAVLPDQPYEGNPSDVLEFPRSYDEEGEGCFMKDEPHLCLFLGDVDCSVTKKCASFWSGNFGSWEGSEERDCRARHPLLGTCSCYGGMTQEFLDPKTDKCVPYADYGETCSNDVPCLPDNFKCKNGRCVCGPRRVVTRVDTVSYTKNKTYYYAVLHDKPYTGNSSDILEFPRFYDEEGKRCFIKDEPRLCLSRGDPDCSVTKSCVTSWSANFGSWEGNSESEDYDARHPLLGTCGCNGGMTREFLDPKTDKCIPLSKYGETCTADVPCFSDDLQCKNGRCACPTEEAIYDSLRGRCVSRIGFKCRRSYDCVSNANCRGTPSVCECREDSVNWNGTCYAKYMTPCGGDSKCDPAGFLKCIDGYCKCGDLLNQVYDSDGLKCQALAGSKCEINNRNSSGAPGCVNAAMCIDGVCKCRTGTIVNSERNCETFRAHGEYCDPKGCNYKYGWACIENACKCVDENLKIKNGKCVSEIGSYCGYVEIVGKRSDRDPDPAKQTYYYVGCDEGICDALVGERSICKKPCSG